MYVLLLFLLSIPLLFAVWQLYFVKTDAIKLSIFNKILIIFKLFFNFVALSLFRQL